MSELIDIDWIEVGDRLRAVDADHVAVIADSIRHCGRVLQPIAVASFFAEKALRPSYKLLAGAHRLAAAKVAGLKQIPVVIHDDLNGLQAKLIEIDENLLRHELNPLDRAVFLAERKRVYEELHPETKAGVAGAKAKHGSANDTMSFAKDAAEKIGLNPRSIERAVSIANGLSPDVRRSLAGTELSKNQKELLLLAKQAPDEQARIVGLIVGGDGSVKSVKAAIASVGGKVTEAPDSSLLQVKRLMDAWRHAGIPARRAFVRDLSETDRLLLRDLLNTAISDTEEAA